MRRAGITFAVATCLLAAASWAEERTRLFVSGHWTLDMVEGLVVPYGRRTATVNGVCNAYSPPGDVQLTFTMGAAGRHSGGEGSDALFIRVTSPNWKYAYKEGPVFLIGGKGLFSPDAWYYGTSITWEPSVLRKDVSDFFATAAVSSLFVGSSGSLESNGDILIIDADEQLLARIPADGLSDVFGKLKECAGIQ